MEPDNTVTANIDGTKTIPGDKPAVQAKETPIHHHQIDSRTLAVNPSIFRNQLEPTL